MKTDLRKEYHPDEKIHKEILSPTTTPAEPMDLFGVWYEEAIQSLKKPGFKNFEPYAMTLSTIARKTTRLVPRSRIVLMREYSSKGIVFYTNYDSNKSKEVTAHPVVSLTFYWPSIERQIRIEGEIIKTSHKESSEYFFSRPPASRVGSAVSKQSALLENRAQLLQEIKKFNEKGEPKHCPPYWGGFRVIPHYFEFWLGRENRLHERLVYEKTHKTTPPSWNKYLLYP